VREGEDSTGTLGSLYKSHSARDPWTLHCEFGLGVSQIVPSRCPESWFGLPIRNLRSTIAMHCCLSTHFPNAGTPGNHFRNLSVPDTPTPFPAPESLLSGWNFRGILSSFVSHLVISGNLIGIGVRRHVALSKECGEFRGHANFVCQSW